MTYELEYPELVIEPEYDWGDSITIIDSNLNYFYVPSIPQWAYSEYDGLLYEGVEYNWSEVDYRLSVEYDVIPESSTVGLLMGLALLTLILFKKSNYARNK